MADSKTDEVNASQTLLAAIADLTPAELTSDSFILVFDVGGQRTFVANGADGAMHKLAHEALDFVHAMSGDEMAAGKLRRAGRLN